MIINKTELNAILNAKHSNPHSLLGLHQYRVKKKRGLVARTFIRNAKSCEIVDIESKPKKTYSLEKISSDGFFEGWIPNRSKVFRYYLRIEKTNGETQQYYDPYSFMTTITDYELHLFNEGNDNQIYEKLGAHISHVNGVSGVSFAVWAPSAKRISVVGDFNLWEGVYHPMRLLGSSGVWELFIPGLKKYTKYKYEIIGADNLLRLKTDPYGVFFESSPNNASIIKDIDKYEWRDTAWMEERKCTDWLKQPISIYEVHFGSWKRMGEMGNRALSYREMARELTNYVKYMGFTHVEFLPLNEHPFTGSWGYQPTGYFAPTHRYGNTEDLMFLIDTLHCNGIGVIMDWVPGHFPKDIFSLAEFDGTKLYEYTDPRKGYHQHWDTLVFNYGRNEVRCFLIASAFSWFHRYHIDGLRVDAVASMLYLDFLRKVGEWIPNEYGGRENLEAMHFIRQLNTLIRNYYPGAIMIAEDSSSWQGVTHSDKENDLGFDFKWNMGWMNDTLSFFNQDPISRKRHLNDLTFASIYKDSENFILTFSHDEVVHGKGSMIMKMGAESMSAKAQNLRALYTLMWFWPGKKSLFMGNEFGQSSEWNHDENLQWYLLQYVDHEGLQEIVRELNIVYKSEPGLYERDNTPCNINWIRANDVDNCVIAFLRVGRYDGESFLVVGNYSSIVKKNYRLGVPYSGKWKEIINSDLYSNGGNGKESLEELVTCDDPNDGYSYSLNLTLPNCTTVIYKFWGKY